MKAARIEQISFLLPRGALAALLALLGLPRLPGYEVQQNEQALDWLEEQGLIDRMGERPLVGESIAFLIAQLSPDARRLCIGEGRGGCTLFHRDIYLLLEDAGAGMLRLSPLPDRLEAERAVSRCLGAVARPYTLSLAGGEGSGELTARDLPGLIARLAGVPQE